MSKKYISDVNEQDQKVFRHSMEALKDQQVSKSIKALKKCSKQIGIFDGFWVHSSFSKEVEQAKDSDLMEFIQAAQECGYLVFKKQSQLEQVDDYGKTEKIEHADQMMKTGGALWLLLHMLGKETVLKRFESQGIITTPMVWEVARQRYEHPVGRLIECANWELLSKWIDHGVISAEVLMSSQWEKKDRVLDTGERIQIKSLPQLLSALPSNWMIQRHISMHPKCLLLEQIVYSSGAMGERNNKGMNALHLAAHMKNYEVLVRMLEVLMNSNNEVQTFLLLDAQDSKGRTLMQSLEHSTKNDIQLKTNGGYTQCMRYLHALQERQALHVESLKVEAIANKKDEPMKKTVARSVRRV